MGQRVERALVLVLLAAHAVLALGFSLGPIFEGPDEIEHYRYVRLLAEQHRLPQPDAQPRGELHHPPLYYALLLPIAWAVPSHDFAQIDGRFNPFYGQRIHLTGNDNKNLYLHTRAERFPYSGSATALAVHLMRLVSVALGTLTVLVSYLLFRLLWPGDPGLRLLAVGIAALWPQFLYLSGVVTNDILLVFLSTLALYGLARVLVQPLTRRAALCLGLALGALLLTKVSAVFVAIPTALVFLLKPRAQRRLALAVVVAVVVAGWWYARNALLFDDPTGSQAMLKTWQTEGIRSGEFALDVALERLPFAYETLWARFGQGAIPVADPFYAFFDGLLILSGIGLGIRGWRRTRSDDEWGRWPLALLIPIYAAIWVAALVYLAAIAWSGNQGRYVLPGIAAWSAILAYGLAGWLPRAWRVGAGLLLTAALGAIAAISLLVYFLPAYRPSPLPDTLAVPLDYRFAPYADLIGFSPVDPLVAPGETTRLTLYWRARRPADRPLYAYLHSAGADVVRRDSLPATGNLLATDWQPGQTWAEHYTVEIPPDAPGQAVFPLVAGLYDPQAEQPLPATDAAGNAVTPVVGAIGVRGPRDGAPFQHAYTLGDSIALAAPEVTPSDGAVEVCLTWRALERVRTGYSVFVHVLADSGDPLGQADAPPPFPTEFWSAGETVRDCLHVDTPVLPAEGWQVALGMYDRATMQRLPVRAASGAGLPHGAVVVRP